MASPTKDQQTEGSSASEPNLDTANQAEESSTSNPSEKEPSTFDVVMNALKPEGKSDDEEDANSEKDDSADTKGDKSKDAKPKEKDDESGDPTEDELKLWKPKTRKRFENLQAKYRDVSERLELAEVDAGHYRKFVDFLDRNGLDQDEANRLFSIGALMKNDPVRALEAITPYYNQLLEVTGQILPPDLVQQVKQGYMTKAAALEVSRARAQGRLQPALAQDQRERQQRQEIRQQGQNAIQMQSAIASWEQKWSKSDPDYASLKDRVLDRLELMLARAAREQKLPKTVEQAVALAEKARKDVETEFRQTRPRKPVSTVEGGGSSSSHQPAPKDTKDVIRRTLNQ